MAKSSIIRRIATAAGCLAALAGTLTSCSPDQVNLLSTVPDSAPAVMTFDAGRFFPLAGLTADGATLTAEKSIAGSPFDLSPLGTEGYNALMHSIDGSHLVFFVDARRTPFLTFEITDLKAFEKFAGEYGEPESSQGFKTWTAADGLKITMRGAQGWISRDPQPGASLKAVLDAAAQQSVMQSIGVANALQDNSQLFNFELNTGGEYRIMAQGMEDSERLGIDFRAMKPDGELMELTQTQTVAEDFLRYTGPEMTIVAAAGLRPEFTSSVDWNAVATAVENMTGLGASPLTMLAPLMADVDGTVALAMGPVSEEAWEEPSLATWHIMLMAHMPMEKILSALDTFSGYFALGGLKPTTDARTGMMTVPFYGSTLRLGPVDGYLAISNTPLEPVEQNSLTPVFNGKQGALSAKLPALDFVPGMQKGMNIEMQLETQRLYVRLMPVDKTSPALGSVLGLLVTLAL